MSNSAVRGMRRSLYMRPNVRRFHHRHADELFSYLQNMENTTSVRALSDTAEIQLNQNAKTVIDGFQFTSSAFRQAAQIIGPGLSKLLPDVAGTVDLDDERTQLVDGPYAIRLWNELVDLRFPLFSRFRVIRNDQNKTIEGFVSHKHQYLDNLALYREVSALLDSQQPDVKMYAAILVGRRFSVWFRKETPIFSLPVDGAIWPFYSGYYFTNGEATGMSVRGTIAIFTPKGVCLGAYRKYGQRVTHIGRDFMARLGEMFSCVLQGELPLDKLQQGAQNLLTSSLGFDVDWNKEQRKERSKKISHSLGLLGVQKNLATEIVDIALAAGRYQGIETQSWSQVNQLYAARTSLDLLIPLLWMARKVDMIRREKLEQAAFDVLMGRLLL